MAVQGNGALAIKAIVQIQMAVPAHKGVLRESVKREQIGVSLCGESAVSERQRQRAGDGIPHLNGATSQHTCIDPAVPAHRVVAAWSQQFFHA